MENVCFESYELENGKDVDASSLKKPTKADLGHVVYSMDKYLFITKGILKKKVNCSCMDLNSEAVFPKCFFLVVSMF